MATADRKRSKNLTREDVEVFTNLIFKYKSTIENKKTDGVTVKQKNEAWSAIASEFSASASHPRTADQLRIFYKNSKSNLKKELAREKVDHFLTGGGSATVKKTKDSPLLQIVQPEVTPLSNPYDSASGYFNDRAQPSTSRSKADKQQEAFEEFLLLGGDPATLGEDEENHASTRSYSTVNPAPSPPGLSIPDPFLDVESDMPVDPTTAAAPIMPAAPTTPLPVAPTTPAAPDGSNVIRNNKRQRINFNSLREYVGELGDLKKRKLELQNKVLELQIKKLERELDE